MSRDTAWRSMYSDMSMRTMFLSVSKSERASALHSSVFPTPVEPRNRKLPWGLLGRPMPARERRTASATACTASSWPTTLWCSSPARSRRRSLSDLASLVTGTPVQRLTTSAICSGPTMSLSMGLSSPASSRCSSARFTISSRRASRSGSLLYRSSATDTLLYRRSASSIAILVSSISFCTILSSSMVAFSVWYRARRRSSSSTTLASSARTSCRRSLLWGSSASDCSAVSSTSSWRRWRSRLSMTSGWESSCTRALAAASSIRSMALSGRRRWVMYRAESFAAATRAPSKIRTPWCVSYRSLIPRRIETVSGTEGSATYTCWKRRSKAESFSTYLRYSSSVVAPMRRSWPRASMGFSRLAASMAPSVFPAPITRCTSSMKRMTLPSASATSASTALSRSSISPRYLAPATSAPMSREMSRQLRFCGTSPRTIRCARASTIAVFPTPASPISTGLFLVRRDSTRTTRRSSSSRPTTGSSLPFSASSVKSVPYLDSASYELSAASPVTLRPPRSSSIAPCSFFLDSPAPSRHRATSASSSAATSRWSTARCESSLSCWCRVALVNISIAFRFRLTSVGAGSWHGSRTIALRRARSICFPLPPARAVTRRAVPSGSSNIAVAT
mmetsp:Transcript_8552/g.24135  ORF Transcript_8552/g.24135 Transcript_8552/m.24135 type:complete len:621 (-) Transcript_8552:238-2100(-)